MLAHGSLLERSIFKDICMYVCMYIYIYIYVCICIYIYIYILFKTELRLDGFVDFNRQFKFEVSNLANRARRLTNPSGRFRDSAVAKRKKLFVGMFVGVGEMTTTKLEPWTIMLSSIEIHSYKLQHSQLSNAW